MTTPFMLMAPAIAGMNNNAQGVEIPYGQPGGPDISQYPTITNGYGYQAGQYGNGTRMPAGGWDRSQWEASAAVEANYQANRKIWTPEEIAANNLKAAKAGDRTIYGQIDTEGNLLNAVHGGMEIVDGKMVPVDKGQYGYGTQIPYWDWTTNAPRVVGAGGTTTGTTTTPAAGGATGPRGAGLPQSGPTQVQYTSLYATPRSALGTGEDPRLSTRTLLGGS